MFAGNQKNDWWRGRLLLWMCGWYRRSFHCASIMFWCNFPSHISLHTYHSSLIFLFSHLFAYISQFTYSIPVYSYAFPTCQGWGVTVTLGIPKAKPEVSAHYAFLLSGRTLKGSLFGGWRPKSDLPSLVDKYADKVLMKTSQETTVSKGEK